MPEPARKTMSGLNACCCLLLAAGFGLADAARGGAAAQPAVFAQARPPVPPAASSPPATSPAARAQALSTAGIAAYKAGRHQEAIQLYTQSLALQANQAIVYYNRGLAHYALRNYTAARDDQTRAIQINPSDTDFFIWRSNSLRMLKDMEGALGDIEHVLKMSPRNTLAFVRRGDIHMARGEYDRAGKDYSAAFEIDPKYAYAVYSRAYLKRVHLRDEEGALEDYGKAIALNARYMAPLSERAALLLQRSDYAGAIADYARAIELQPNNANWRNQRAWSYFKNGEAAKGLPDADTAVRLSGRTAAYLDTRAHIHEAMGARNKALADYRAALKLDPKLRESLAGLRRLERSSTGPQSSRGTSGAGSSASAGPRPAEQVGGPYDASAPSRSRSGGPRAQ